MLFFLFFSLQNKLFSNPCSGWFFYHKLQNRKNVKKENSLEKPKLFNYTAGCCLGEGVIIGPNVVLYENTMVGARSRIHAGTVIGTHGFGYRQVDGRHVPTAQLGHVAIGEDVEIGANVTVDRGTYGTTRIGDGTG